jgi:hypothetical protein
MRHAASISSCPAARVRRLCRLLLKGAPLHFHYTFTVKNVSPGERVRVWIPLAHSDAFQDVKVTSKRWRLAAQNRFSQPEYGNEVLYAETSKADKGEYKFSVDYDVVRREHVVLVNGKPATGTRPPKRRTSSWRVS